MLIKTETFGVMNFFCLKTLEVAKIMLQAKPDALNINKFSFCII